MTYSGVAHDYLSKGWSPLPLPAGRKAPPPKGWTGYAAPTASGADVQEWIDQGHGDGNVALRLPETVLGLDLDAYDGKSGADTMRDHISRLGPLPPSPRSSGREGASGIRFYRVPPGRSWADTLGPGVEVIHHGHRYAVAQPSVHPSGATYQWYDDDGAELSKLPSVDDLPELPQAWVDHLDCGATGERQAVEPASSQDVANFWANAPEGMPCRYVERLVAETVEALGGGGSRHDAARDNVLKVVRAAEQGHQGGQTALDTIEAAFASVTHHDAQRPRDPGEWSRMLTGAVALVKTSPTPEQERGCRCPPDVWTMPENQSPDRGLRDDLLTHLRTWQGGEDFAHLDFALAVAVSAADTTGDPLWGMIVGPPSSGKTETVRALDDVADDCLDEITTAALLSWTRGSKPKATGVLTRVPDPALLTVADFSTILATSDRGGRDQLFSDLRRVYDGSLRRDLGNAPKPLRWSGRLTILSAVTPAIDDYSSHSDALGPRWLYLRMPGVDPTQRRDAAGRRRVALKEKRADARQLAVQVVQHGRASLPQVGPSDASLRTLGDASVVTAAARGAVPRDGYGRREVIGVPTIEEPHRLVGQLQMLARALLALGHSADYATALAVRASLDTIPRARMAVLWVLASLDEPVSVGRVAHLAGLHRRVAATALEDLREVGLTCCPIEDDPELDDTHDLGTKRRDWQLTPAPGLGVLARNVVYPHSTRKGGTTPPSPQ